MNRVIVLICVGLTALPAFAQKDEIAVKLTAAKDAYRVEMEAWRKGMFDWFDRREDAARKNGDKKLVDQIKVERDAFKSSGTVPKNPPDGLKLKPATAKSTMEVAYRAAIRDYVKARKDPEADALDLEMADFRSGKLDLMAKLEPKPEPKIVPKIEPKIEPKIDPGIVTGNSKVIDPKVWDIDPKKLKVLENGQVEITGPYKFETLSKNYRNVAIVLIATYSPDAEVDIALSDGTPSATMAQVRPASNNTGLIVGQISKRKVTRAIPHDPNQIFRLDFEAQGCEYYTYVNSRQVDTVSIASVDQNRNEFLSPMPPGSVSVNLMKGKMTVQSIEVGIPSSLPPADWLTKRLKTDDELFISQDPVNRPMFSNRTHLPIDLVRQDDYPSTRGTLVGFEVGTRKVKGRVAIGYLCAQYMVGKEIVSGKAFGTKPESTTRLVAKPGYSVYGLKVCSSDILEGLSVDFIRDTNGTVDESDKYESEFVGGEGQFKRFIHKKFTLIGGVGICTSRASGEIVDILLYLHTKYGSPTKLTGGVTIDLIYLSQETDSILVGFHLSTGKFGKVDCIHYLQPIYRTGDKDTVGPALGKIQDPVVTLKAKPGYAVGAVKLLSGLNADGMSLTFMKVKGENLDPKDSYTSDWVGYDDGRKTQYFDGQGRPFTGIYGRHNLRNHTGLGFIIRPDLK